MGEYERAEATVVDRYLGARARTPPVAHALPEHELRGVPDGDGRRLGGPACREEELLMQLTTEESNGAVTRVASHPLSAADDINDDTHEVSAISPFGRGGLKPPVGVVARDNEATHELETN